MHATIIQHQIAQTACVTTTTEIYVAQTACVPLQSHKMYIAQTACVHTTTHHHLAQNASVAPNTGFNFTKCMHSHHY